MSFRLRRVAPTVLTALLLISTASTAATITHYDVDFGLPHTIGSAPTVGIGSGGPSEIPFGVPTVESSLLSLTTPMLRFDTFGAPGSGDRNIGEQVKFELGLGYDNYDISFDVVTVGLTGNNFSFSVHLDGLQPSGRSLSFNGGRRVPFNPGVRWFNGFSPSEERSGIITSFEDGTLYHVNMNVDLTQDLWTMSVNGVLDQTLFSNLEAGLGAVRFTMSESVSGAGTGNGIFAGLDNVLITSNVVPEPSTGLLLGVSLGWLSIWRRIESKDA